MQNSSFSWNLGFVSYFEIPNKKLKINENLIYVSIHLNSKTFSWIHSDLDSLEYHKKYRLFQYLYILTKALLREITRLDVTIQPLIQDILSQIIDSSPSTYFIILRTDTSNSVSKGRDVPRDVPGQTGTGRPVVPLSRDKKKFLSWCPFVPGQNILFFFKWPDFLFLATIFLS